MSFVVWQWNGRYIRGTKLGSYKRPQGALEKAKSIPGFKEIHKLSAYLLVVNKDGIPIGIIEKEMPNDSGGLQPVPDSEGTGATSS